MHSRFAIWGLMGVGGCALVLLLNGRWFDPWVWSYCAVWLGTVSYGLLGIDTELARERFDPPAPGADATALKFVRLLGIGHLVVGAVDAGRWHVTTVPPLLRGIALAGMALSFILVYRSMHENRFFSAVVRLQEERGHSVVDTGPYAVIRHPGYAGMIAGVPFSGLALGSWVSFAIAIGYSVLLVRRVLFEDAFLARNLDGYAAYSRRVTRRLVPRTW
jgi:protein-S-isoprenylcysteine O-methyltransferase Ste14